MDTIGGILATLMIMTDAGGFGQLLEWATGFGKILAFGVEGNRFLWSDAVIVPAPSRLQGCRGRTR